MNKEQFLAALRARLTQLPPADLEKTLQYYREMIDDRVEEGMSEAAAVVDVGDPAELAAAILQKPAAQAGRGEGGTMSRTKRILLSICAAVMAVAGVLLVGDGTVRAAAVISGGKDASKEYSFASGEVIRSLEIESGAAQVKLLPASDGVCRVRFAGNAARNYKVWVNEGTLHVERVNRWSLFGFSLKEDSLQIDLPERAYESLWIKSSSGGVDLPRDFRFRVAIVKTSSGGIGCAADVTEEMNLQASSGGISVSGASPASLFVSVSSGGIALSDMQPGSVELHSSSGGMRVSGVRCSALRAECSSGSIRLSDVIADGSIDLDCSSGSIKLDDCDASELRIECTSGSVSGHLLTPKVWSASSTSGSVRVPADGSGGVCNVHTTSGSIRFD